MNFNRKGLSKITIILVVVIIILVITIAILFMNNLKLISSKSESLNNSYSDNENKSNSSVVNVDKTSDSTTNSTSNQNSTITPSSTAKTVVKTYNGMYDGTVIKLYSDCSVTVTMSNTRFWSDVAEPNTTEESNRKETISNIKDKERKVLFSGKVEDIFPTCISNNNNATREYAVFKTVDKKYYIVDLVCLNTKGLYPQAIQELVTIEGKDIVSVSFNANEEKLRVVDSSNNETLVNIVAQ